VCPSFVCQEIAFRALGETIRAIRKISINFEKFGPAFGKISKNFDGRLGEFRIWLCFEQFRIISKNLANSPVSSKHPGTRLATLARQHPAVSFKNLSPQSASSQPQRFFQDSARLGDIWPAKAPPFKGN